MKKDKALSDNRVKEVEAQRDEKAKSAEEWKQLFFDERKTSDKFAASARKFEDEAKGYLTALNKAQSQHELDLLTIAERDKRISDLKADRIKYAIYGAVVGGGIALSVRARF